MCALGAAVVKVDRMIAIQIGELRDEIGISRPECARIVVSQQPEGISTLPQTVDIGRVRQARTQPEILRLKDQGMTGRVKENLAGGLAGHFERERVLLDGDVQV